MKYFNNSEHIKLIVNVLSIIGGLSVIGSAVLFVTQHELWAYILGGVSLVFIVGFAFICHSLRKQNSYLKKELSNKDTEVITLKEAEASLNEMIIKLQKKVKVYSVANDDNIARGIAYAELFKKTKANGSIHALGINHSNIMRKEDELHKLLERDVHITLLGFDFENGCEKTKKELLIKCAERYGSDLNKNNKFEVITSFINERKEKRKNSAVAGRAELREYTSFIPMNITIADMDSESPNMIIEFCMLYHKRINRKRLILCIDEDTYDSDEIKEIAENAKNIVNKVQEESTITAKDYE